MANANNLKNGEATQFRAGEEQVEIARLGGIASGKARREKQKTQQILSDLLSIKNESEELPVIKNIYLVISNQLYQANKKSILTIEGVDKKSFTDFLKSNDIKWKDVKDLVKVVDYITSLK